MEALTYNPAQRQVLDLLGRARQSEPVAFPPDIAEQCYAALHAGLADVAGHVATAGAERAMFVSKHDLAAIHACEAEATAPAQPFEWSVLTARGTVVHKAIELSVHWRGEAPPGVLVTEAIARLGDAERGPGPWLASLTDGELAELTATSTDLVSKFAEAFPPLKAEWRPVTETKVHVQLFDGALVLSGACDLVLGRPEPPTPRRVIVDFKTGLPVATHREDLRFYALLETLRNGVPPRLVAGFYLDLAYVDRDRLQAETVTPALLDAAIARVIDGVRTRIDIGTGRRPAARRAGPTCRWCAMQATCPDGQAHLAATALRWA